MKRVIKEEASSESGQFTWPQCQHNLGIVLTSRYKPTSMSQ